MSQERIDLLKQFIKDEPENPFNRYALAMEYYEHDPVQSCDLLSLLSKSDPGYLPTYFKLAHLYWDAEEWDAANNIFKKGIALAIELDDQKALRELRSASQNFEFERE